jgi:hypothetical protein
MFPVVSRSLVSRMFANWNDTAGWVGQLNGSRAVVSTAIFELSNHVGAGQGLISNRTF